MDITKTLFKTYSFKHLSAENKFTTNVRTDKVGIYQKKPFGVPNGF